MGRDLILGIECSCDDSSVAVYSIHEDRLYGMRTYSSRAEHIQFGGIVPEIAARAHEREILKIVESLLKDLNLKLKDLGYISYSSSPGLESSLLVGRMIAHTLASVLELPIYPIDHLEAHIFSIGLHSKVNFPSISLLITGKNTSIYYLESDLSGPCLLDKSGDCALGEAYDKVARLMGLGASGGKALEKYYKADIRPESLTYRKKQGAKLSLNFSGLISSSARYWKRLNSLDNGGLDIETKRVRLSTAFQDEVVYILHSKIEYWLKKYPSSKKVYIVGGVSKNKIIRSFLIEFFGDEVVCFVDPEYAEDNGAMIAYRASLIIRGEALKSLS